jgi:hypothetical protein
MTAALTYITIPQIKKQHHTDGVHQTVYTLAYDRLFRVRGFPLVSVDHILTYSAQQST